MSATFYLFDVDHGQCAAMHLPNNRWCIFDVGRTADFSPVQWITRRNQGGFLTQALGFLPDFRFLKGTISHLHGDHLADWENLLQFGPEFLKSVDVDQEYLADCYATCASESSKATIRGFVQGYGAGFSPAVSMPDYAGVQIRELCLPVAVARQIGGDANSRVNNASVITRIDVYGNSILLCGDLQKEAWEAIINDRSDYGQLWRPFLTGIDIMVAPHHGHRSGYSVDLLNLTKPAIVLVSVVSRDTNVDGRYSQAPVRGMTIGGTSYGYISTRQNGHIKINNQPPAQPWPGQKGMTYWTFGDAALQ